MEGELAHDTTSLLYQRNRRGKLNPDVGPLEHRARLIHEDFVFVSGIIHRREALHPESHGPADYVYPADNLIDLMLMLEIIHGHEIDDFGDSFMGKEPCDQNVGLRPVELFVRRTALGRSNLEIPAFLLVKDGSEDAGRVESWAAEPID